MSIENMIIAGPCAAESRDQIINCASALKERGVSIMRASLLKPRTKPGFDGVGVNGIPWLAQATKLGITVATEVLLPEHVSDIIEGIEKEGNPSQVLLWLGSRNQNHLVQQSIARRIKDIAPAAVKLMIKNQPWADEAHWLGIVEHCLHVGLPPERLLLCHRGFAPSRNANNLHGFRNPPDFEMAMRVKEKTGLPMLLDPSHIVGDARRVVSMVKLAQQYDFDGIMVEVHPHPQEARTDSRQQLNLDQFDDLLRSLEYFNY